MMEAKTVPATPPSAWEFGGFPYGLEPLRLPDPISEGGATAHGDEPTARGLHPSCAQLLLSWHESSGLPPVDDEESERELYWFRWITGHQVSFIIWRLMAEALHRAKTPEHRIDALATLAEYVDGYSAMLLYTSSCTRELYHGWIRPSMYLQHRCFSGGWAPDHAPVRDFLRGRRSALTEAPEASDLRRAIRLGKAVHAGVAAKLVPNGRSLLRQSVGLRQTQDSQVHGLIYDNYFMTLRGPTPRDAVVGQLVRRLTAVGQDVTANGLYPSPADAVEIPTELRSDEAAALERGFLPTMFRISGAALGVSAPVLARNLAAQGQRCWRCRQALATEEAVPCATAL